MSPLGADGMVIAHVGGHGGGALTAFAAASGDLKWQWKDDGPAYASPVLSDVGGMRAVVTQTESHVAALRLSDGKLLWKAPFTTSYVQNSVTPVDLGGGALVYSGLNNGVTAVKLAPGGDAWTAKPLWQTSEASFYMNTPVRVGGALYGLSHRNKGEFVALDAASGKLLWKSPPRQGDNAAIIAAGETLLLLATDGQLTVARAAPRAFEVVKRYTVASAPTWAHPALIPGGLVVKDVSHLILWRFR
jgi:outer membrane protein assembly factor BamB